MFEDNSRLRTRNPELLTNTGLTFRFMRKGEEPAICEFVHRVFDLSVAPLYTEKGQRSFKEYADPEKMSARTNGDHFVLLALIRGSVAGMIEMRRSGHCTLLFVQPDSQGKGIGGRLLGKAVEICRSTDPRLKAVTVNSSPGAVRSYERMGFQATGGQQEISGVRSVPMKKVLG